MPDLLVSPHTHTHTTMNLDFDTILNRAEELYAEKLLGHQPEPGVRASIGSDQGKCVLRAVVEALNQTEKQP